MFKQLAINLGEINAVYSLNNSHTNGQIKILNLRKYKKKIVKHVCELTMGKAFLRHE